MKVFLQSALKIIIKSLMIPPEELYTVGKILQKFRFSSKKKIFMWL